MQIKDICTSLYNKFSFQKFTFQENLDLCQQWSGKQKEGEENQDLCMTASKRKEAEKK